MSLFDQTKNAFAQCEGFLAQMQGMPAGAAGNTLFAGQAAEVVGVYGNPQHQEIMMGGGPCSH